MTRLFFYLFAAAMCCASLVNAAPGDKPALYLIGDSTVKNGTQGKVGWGTSVAELFDKSRISVANHALGGRSSRSYLREGLWDAVREKLQPGDFVIMQFGHNDGGPFDDAKARASIKGNGEDVKEVTLTTGKLETVHSYGWYLRKYIAEAKEKGATPIVCSQVPRNIWTGKTITRAAGDYGKWAKEAAQQGGALFLDLNELVAKKYEDLGPEEVLARFFDAADHTHTNEAGARFTAGIVADGLRDLRDCKLGEFLVDKPVAPATTASAGIRP